jgi:4-amino-4-deoxy-L-arabinose transferase-like glycosyltransferase
MVVTALFAVLSGAFWFGLARHGKARPLSPNRLLALVFSVGLVCRLAFVFFTPTFHAPDEESHYNYVKYLVEQRAFPVQVSKLGDPGNEMEYFQPPLYYLLLTPIFLLGHVLSDSDAFSLSLMRLFSVALWVFNVGLAQKWLNRLEVRDGFERIFVLGMVCLLPTYTFTSAAVNNDNLLNTLGGGLLCLMARRSPDLKTSVSAGLLLGLALLTKQSAAVFVPALVILAAYRLIMKPVAWQQSLGHLVVVGAIAAALFLPRLAWNWRTYESLTPEFLLFTPRQWPSLAHGLGSAAHNVVKTFWATSGIANEVAYPFPLVGMALIGLCIMARQEGVRSTAPEHNISLRLPGEWVVAWLIAILFNLALVLRFSYVSGMGQGRHLFPVLFPLALALAVGLRPLPLRHGAIHVVGFWVSYAATFVAFSFSRFP